MFEPFLKAMKGLEARVVPYPPELSSYADCVSHVRRQLPSDRPFLLLGESFSGPVALALAAEGPRGLVGLVLCGSFARNPRPGLAWAAPLLRLLPPLRLPMVLLRHLLLGPWETAALLALAQGLRLRVPAGAMKARLLAVLTLDPPPRLGPIQVPVLALQASADRLVPHSATAWLREHLPGLDVFTLQGPHWLLQTRPEAAAPGD
jgi:pimeloyl-ACP methyl ester carboxylesterase